MLRYDINSGVKKIKTKTAILASTIILGFGGATFGLAIPLAAHAAPGGSSGNYCGASANGCTSAANAGAQCGTGAGSGTFGALGKDNSLGAEKVHDPGLGSYPGPGTDGYQTGLNNSSICGNR